MTPEVAQERVSAAEHLPALGAAERCPLVSRLDVSVAAALSEEVTPALQAHECICN